MRTVAALVLAAGRGIRFELAPAESKLNTAFRGTPIVRRVVETALRSRAKAVIVVSGHAHDRVIAALEGLDVRIIQNAGYASGLAGSIKAGLAGLGSDVEGALMMLGDMPLVTVETLDALIECFESDNDKIDAVVPTFEGTNGNPVLIGKKLFERLGRLRGDQGARLILADPNVCIAPCAVSNRGILIDVDTQNDLAELESADQ